jgi:hypothetical protein
VGSSKPIRGDRDRIPQGYGLPVFSKVISSKLLLFVENCDAFCRANLLDSLRPAKESSQVFFAGTDEGAAFYRRLTKCRHHSHTHIHVNVH